MSSVINTNMSSLYAQKSLAYAQSELINSVQKLSSGQRVSNTLDDSSGLALAVSIQALSNTFIQSVSNIRNITSIVKIADNALGQVERIL
jgi:flagellin